MLDFNIVIDPISGEKRLETSITGKALLTLPQLNKGTAFTKREREDFGLSGKLPMQVEELDAQVQRAYIQFQGYQTDLQKNIYLNNLHDKNQILFYRLISDHLAEMVPLVYTPIVGNAVKKFSLEFRQPRGLYISYPESEDIGKLLSNRTCPEIDLIVVSDGEGVLGIGDQGVGAIDIPIAKLMVYSFFGGIDPNRTLPIVLDVGTNNEELLNDPFYLGWRHKRISGQEYHEFIEHFITALEKTFPWVFLHYEDFGRDNARVTLDKFRQRICSFNDDIQGTGVAALAALMTACHVKQEPLTEQNIIIFGAGTAGMGITDQIADAMVRQGLSLAEARSRFWLIDRQGLLINDMTNLTPSQQHYTKAREQVKNYATDNEGRISLAEVVNQIKASVLIGCSAQPGVFTQAIVETMAQHCARPIIFPLSNPNNLCEAIPDDLLAWTNGRALVSTGSPFPHCVFQQKHYAISQCNNAYVFPGIGLGLVATHAKELTDTMIWAACNALVKCAIKSNLQQPTLLLPTLDEAQQVAIEIGTAVAKQAYAEHLVQNNAVNNEDAIKTIIERIFWNPKYLAYTYRKAL